MPMHDWTRVRSGTYHHFHQDWTIELARQLNRGILPRGYSALADQRVNGPESDVVTFHRTGKNPVGRGTSVLDAPLRTRMKAQLESDATAYARKANRIAITLDKERVVAMIEIVSPGNKDSRHAMNSFTNKAVEFLQNGIHILIVDPFPPTRRDPEGIHQVIWEELSNTRFETRPSDKPLTAASFDAADTLTAYVEPFAVGDRIPDMPLFLEPGWYVQAPLESSYQVSLDSLAEDYREDVLAAQLS